MKPFLLISLVISSAAITPASAESLTLERIFESPALDGPSDREPQLAPDGAAIAVLRARAEDRSRFDLWLIEPGSGKARMLVDSEKLESGAPLSEAEMMHRERLRIGGTKGIADFQWAPDGHALLFMLDGDLYLAALDGTVRRLTETEGTELAPHISGDGHHVSFVRDGNLVVADLDRGTESQLTEDGSDTVGWGTAEFVAQEEMGRYEGQWWAPDGSRIAAQRTDESRVDVVTRTAIGATGTRVFDQRYPTAGTANADVSLWVMKPDGSGKVRVDMGNDPEAYLARVDWAPDGSALYVQRQNREETVLDLLKVDPATGAATVLFSERSGPESWVNLQDNFRALRDGSILWWSERDGHGHLYRFAGGNWTRITSGDWEVKSVIGVDEARGLVYFTGNRETPLERQVYLASYREPATPRRLTESGWWNEARMDGAATRMIVTRSNPDQPPQSYVADTGGRRLAWLSENAVTPGHPYYPYRASHRETRFGTITAEDGTVLHWEIITPELEPGKRYPVFFEHYGGPTVQRVTRAWGGPMRQYWVDHGWIWFQIDNRGSANRGKAFEDQIWHHLGSVEVADQVAGARYLQSLPFVDPGRIATYGWSYGGYMTLKMLEQAPGVFAAGISGAPVTQWGIYDTHATERFLGNPSIDPRPYELSDALPYAASIRDPLLMIHGMSDDNVVFEQGTSFYAALQQARIPFEMMTYPGMTHHFIGVGPNVHLWQTIEDFLDRRVKNPSAAETGEAHSSSG